MGQQLAREGADEGEGATTNVMFYGFPGAAMRVRLDVDDIPNPQGWRSVLFVS